MEPLLDRILFSVEDDLYRWSDAALWAHLRGRWAVVQRQARQGLACVQRQAEEDHALGEEGVRSLGEAFRYERNLLSADETVEWLNHHDLDESDWIGYIRRLHLRDLWADELERIVERYPPSVEELDAVVLAEAVCSRILNRAAEELAGRVAVGLRIEANDETASLVTGAVAEAGPPRIPGLDPAAAADRMRTLATIDILAGRALEAAVTREAIEREVASNALTWMSFACTTAYLADPDAGREVVAQIREGRDLAEVASEAGSQAASGRVFLDAVSADLADRLVGVAEGDILGPLATSEGWLVLVVDRRVEPSADDAEVRDRASDAIRTRLEEREKNAMVRWHERL